MSDQPAPDHRPDLRDVQGNLVGFNKDHQRLVFLQFADQASAAAFLAELEPSIASGFEVKRFNELYKEVRARRRGEKGIIQATWTNIAFTAAGLEVLGASGVEAFPADFREGMAAQAAQIGDVDSSAPQTWRPPFDQPGQVHAMVILAADDLTDLDAGHARLQQKLAAHGVSELGHQDGNVRPDPFRGHEHFGFKDGISQPSIRGLTTSSKGGEEIASGEFLVGYRDEDGNVSGRPGPAPPPPQPGEPGYGQPVPPAPSPLPDWAKDGSFVVYRRLRQDVGAFRRFATEQAAAMGMSPDQLGAKLVGRWPSGTAMERVPGLPHGVDPSVADPSAEHPHVLDDDNVNRFTYAHDDADGHRVPRAAHIRKANPRDEEPPGRAEANRHRILRRGIPYGPDFQPEEQPYGGGPVGDDRDRGLLFLCYHSSIARGFAFVQQSWANTGDFPQPGDGHDPIITQSVEPRDMAMPPGHHLQMSRWVFTTGGDYFFAPSLPALRLLAGTAHA